MYAAAIHQRCSPSNEALIDCKHEIFPFPQLQLLGPPGPRGVLLSAFTEALRLGPQLPHVSSPAILPGANTYGLFDLDKLPQHLFLQAITTASSLQLVYLQVNITDSLSCNISLYNESKTSSLLQGNPFFARIFLSFPRAILSLPGYSSLFSRAILGPATLVI